MKKITLEKDEGVAEAIDRMLGEPDNDIAFVIPNGSILGKTARNFSLLKREAIAAGRDVTVESVDENILALARENGMTGSHPFWAGSTQGGFSDILPGANDREDDPPVSHKAVHLSLKSRAAAAKSEIDRNKTSAKKKTAAETPVKIAVQNEDDEEEEDDGDEMSAEDSQENEYRPVAAAEKKETAPIAAVEKNNAPAIKNFFSRNRFFKDTPPSDISDDGDDDNNDAAPRRHIGKKTIGYVALGVIVLAFIFFGVPKFFGSIKITIDFNKTPWTYSHAFAADKSVATSTAAASVDTIPAQVFTATNSTVQSFHASGNADVSLKATGIVTIYNDYSAAPQELVATTRFLTPDGKLFRLVNTVTVPGATTANGRLVPSSINASIVADKAGTAYNVGPVAKLTIPGFQGSAKYNGFYGSIASSTTGGFVGGKAVPTANDVATAEANVKNILQSSQFDGAALAKIPENFEIPDGATSTAITKLAVNTSTDQSGDFKAFGTVVFQAIGFDKTKLEAFLLAQAQSGGTTSTTFNNSLNFNYSGVHADFTNGVLNFTLNASGTLEPSLSIDDFRNDILGKSTGDVRSKIETLPDLADSTISVWPFWLGTVPSDSAKVQITVN